MKQKKFGKKVQNWHRPLAPGALKRRYRRTREQAINTDEQFLHANENNWAGPFCGVVHVGPRDPGDENYCDNCWTYLGGDPDEEYALVQVLHKLRDRLMASPFVHVLKDLHPESQQSALNDAQSRALEQKLLHYIVKLRALKDTIEDDLAWRLARTEIPSPLLEDLIYSIDGYQNYEVIVGHKESVANYQIHVLTILLFSPFWVRPPTTWKPNSCVSLEEHLFCSFPIPAALKFLWQTDIKEISHEFFISIFILIGQGGSIKRFAEQMDWNVPGNLVNLLEEVPDNGRVYDPFVYAEIIRLGGSERHYHIMTHWVIGDTSNPFFLDTNTRLFWEASARWIIQYCDELDLHECSQILEWAYDKFREDRRFRWKGRRAEPTLHTAVAATGFQRMGEAYHFSWPDQGWDWTYEHPILGVCHFHELTNGKALYEEGVAQRHCVANLARAAKAGNTAIFSIHTSSGARLTISVELCSKRPPYAFEQIAGACNRPPTPDELEVVTAWKNEMGHMR